MPLSDSLSNPGQPLVRLKKAVEAAGGVAHLQGETAAAREELIAQTGAEDATSVRVKITENRKLSPAEVTELIAAYQAGTSQGELSRRYGLHIQTVKAHLRRHGVTIRPVQVLTAEQQDEAVRLYVDEAWSLREVASTFGVNPDTVRRTLAGRGIPRRSRGRQRR